MRWNKYEIAATITVGTILLAIFVVMVVCLRWMIMQPFWGYPLQKWLKTATIGEVALLFGGLLFAIRFLTTSSVTVKKDG